jgi:DNA-binding Lrp family transcriptional regulator
LREILELLESDARLSTQEIADRLGIDVKQVEAAIGEAQSRKILLGHTAVVNWESTDNPKVFAFINVGASPEHGTGFDKIAEYISQFEEVHSVYLMSGGFDLHVVVEGEDFREIARFVAEKLAPIPGVRSTTTAFVLKTYKLEGISIDGRHATNRLAVSP